MLLKISSPLAFVAILLSISSTVVQALPAPVNEGAAYGYSSLTRRGEPCTKVGETKCKDAKHQLVCTGESNPTWVETECVHGCVLCPFVSSHSTHSLDLIAEYDHHRHCRCSKNKCNTSPSANTSGGGAKASSPKPKTGKVKRASDFAYNYSSLSRREYCPKAGETKCKDDSHMLQCSGESNPTWVETKCDHGCAISRCHLLSLLRDRRPRDCRCSNGRCNQPPGLKSAGPGGKSVKAPATVKKNRRSDFEDEKYSSLSRRLEPCPKAGESKCKDDTFVLLCSGESGPKWVQSKCRFGCVLSRCHLLSLLRDR
jgi:hypothetical protein